MVLPVSGRLQERRDGSLGAGVGEGLAGLGRQEEEEGEDKLVGLVIPRTWCALL